MEREEYYKAIGLSDVAQKRAESIIREVEGLFDIKISDVLVCKIFKNGDTEYTSLWLFNNDYGVECKEFLSQDNFYLLPINEMFYVDINRIDYSDMKPTYYSKVVVQIGSYSNIVCTLTSFGISCQYVEDIVKKYFRPKLSINKNRYSLKIKGFKYKHNYSDIQTDDMEITADTFQEIKSVLDSLFLLMKTR